MPAPLAPVGDDAPLPVPVLLPEPEPEGLLVEPVVPPAPAAPPGTRVWAWAAEALYFSRVRLGLVALGSLLVSCGGI